MLHSRHAKSRRQFDAYADADCHRRQTAIVSRLGHTALILDTVCLRQAVFICIGGIIKSEGMNDVS